MKKIINYIKTHKELTIIILLALLFIINQFLKTEGGKGDTTPSITPGQKQTSYKTLIPGTSTEEEMKKVMGEPLKVKEEGSKKISEFKSSSQYRNNEGITENGKVTFIKEIVTIGDGKKTTTITDIYGPAPFILYEESPNSTFNLYIYPDLGLAYKGHIDGTLLEIWYFVPTTFSNFRKAWGEQYSQVPQTENIPTGQIYY